VRGALMAAVQCDTEPLDDECAVASPTPTASRDRQADPRALLVLMGSTLTALRAKDVRPASQQRALALAAIQLYAPLAHSVGFGAAFAELEHLAYTNLFPEQLRRLQRWYAMVWPDAPTQLAQFRTSLEGQLRSSAALNGLVVNLAVLGRVKTVTSTFRKLLRDQMPVEQVKDVLALRVTFSPASTAGEMLMSAMGKPLSEGETDALLCHGVYRQVMRSSMWTEVPGRFKDLVTAPKPNGYQSLHTNCWLADGRIVEVQVRTDAMHERAESGTAAHEVYRASQMSGSVTPALLQGDNGRSVTLARSTGMALRSVQADAAADDEQRPLPALVAAAAD